MRFFHISDLHIGKHLHYYDLKEDQRYTSHGSLTRRKNRGRMPLSLPGTSMTGLFPPLRQSPSLTGSSPDWRTSGQPSRCWPLPGTMTRRNAGTMPVPSLEGSTSTWPACLLPGRKNG